MPNYESIPLLRRSILMKETSSEEELRVGNFYVRVQHKSLPSLAKLSSILPLSISIRLYLGWQPPKTGR